LAAFCIAAPAVGEDRLDRALGPLAAEVTLGTEGAWAATEVDGWLSLENRSAPGALRYHHVSPGALVSGVRVTGAEVAVAPAAGMGLALAGLLFNFAETEAGPRYMIFTLSNEGEIAIYVRGEAGLQKAGAAEIRAEPDVPARLEILERPGKASFLYNGAEAFSAETETHFRGGVGIVAAGQGRFRFGGFSIKGSGEAQRAE